jgi:hypothetical protein
MQLVPNQIPPERLITSMDAQERTPAPEASDSPFVLKGAGMMSGNSRWIFLGAMIGAMLLSVGGIIFNHWRTVALPNLHQSANEQSRGIGFQ